MIKFKNEYIAPIAIHPGETLQDIIESLDMSQAELADRLGMSKKVVNEIIKGKAPITHETAINLEYIFSSPASFWNNLQSNYDDTLERMTSQERMKNEVEIARQIPYNEMVKFGWAKPANSIEEKINNMRGLLKIASLNNIEKALCVNLRCSNSGTTSIYALAAWIQICTNMSSNIETMPYDSEKLKNCLPEIRSLSLQNPEVFVPKLKSIFSSCGVAFVLLQHFTNTKLHGVTKWINPNKAMIALTIRCKYADIFWFSLMHEIGHVLQHKTKQTFINQENVSEKDELEEQADIFASKTWIPGNEYKKLVSTQLTKDKIIEFSHKNNINPCIVVGRLQHDKIIKYSQFSDLKIRYDWASNKTN
jgi:HTH-type transcriptional regulator / antitoxin HigA